MWFQAEGNICCLVSGKAVMAIEVRLDKLTAALVLLRSCSCK